MNEENCPHLHVILYTRLYRRMTLYTPAEYEQKIYCKDCGEWMDVEDCPDNDEIEIEEATCRTNA